MNYQQPVLQSSVSHDPSEIIGAQETSYTFLVTFVMNLLYFFMNRKFKEQHLFQIEIICTRNDFQQCKKINSNTLV